MIKLFKKTVDTSPVRAEFGATVGRQLDSVPKARRVDVQGVQVYCHDDFLTAAQCRTLIRLIDADRRPSTLLGDQSDVDFRTSESCDMNRWSPDVRPIDEKVAGLLGVDPVFGETMQGQRYAPGQHFRAHHDYFFSTESYWHRVRQYGGQRTWTAMIYLNDVEEGGATWFPEAGIRIAPKRGLLLTWNNMRADGSPNPLTLHEGMPVVKGVKYIVTKWFREDRWIKD